MIEDLIKESEGALGKETPANIKDRVLEEINTNVEASVRHGRKARSNARTGSRGRKQKSSGGDVSCRNGNKSKNRNRSFAYV